MKCKNDCSFNACGCLGLLLSIIFAVAIGLLFFFGFIPSVIFASGITFGLAVLTLIFLVIGAYAAAIFPSSILAKCICKNAKCLLVAVLGTLITSIALLIIITGYILTTIIVAIDAFFFALMILGIIALLNCIIKKVCAHKDC